MNEALPYLERKIRASKPKSINEINKLDRLTAVSIWSIMLSSVINELLGGTYIFSLGFYSLHIVDPAIVLVIISTIAAVCSRRITKSAPFILSSFLAILISVNMVRGLSENPGSALLWARVNLATAALPLLAATCRASGGVQRTFRNAVVASGTITSMLCLLRLMLGPDLFMINVDVDINMINDGGRPLTAAGAFNVALAASIVLSEIISCKRRKNNSSAIFLFLLLFVSEILSGQGTSSIALIIMLLTVFFLQPGAGYRSRIISAVPLLSIVAFFALLVRVFSYRIANLGPFDLTRRSDNLGTREAAWTAFKKSFSDLSLYDQMIGIPAGRDMGLFVYRSGHLMIWNAELHSTYYGAMKNIGYLGLTILIALVSTLSIKLLMNILSVKRTRLAPAYAIAMCLGTAIFSFSYELRNYTLMGLFIAIWWYRFPKSDKV